MRGLRRDPVPQAPQPALRRPGRHRERHRLLVHLRRQPAHHALDGQPGRARTGLGQLALRGQRGVRPRHARRHRQAGGVRARAGGPARPGPRRPRPRPARGRPVRGARHRGPARAGRPAPAAPRGPRLAGGARAPERGRRAGGAERVDRGRRRVGLRHRLRRARPRPRGGPQGERARAGHRGLLEHRRPGVEGDPPRGGRQVRGGRQDHRQEGPGADGDDVRHDLRRAGGDGRQRHPDHPGLPRGGGLPGVVADHRLQPLHRPRLRPAPRHGPAEGRGALRPLAALPLQPAPGPRGRPALELDSKPPSLPLKAYAYNETRYTMLAHSDPETARRLLERGPGGRARALAALRAVGRAVPGPPAPEARA